MKIYNCNPNTKEYIGASKADLDPMATIREGKEVYALPANASFNKPPDLIEGYWRKLINGEWVQEIIPAPPVIAEPVTFKPNDYAALMVIKIKQFNKKVAKILNIKL